MDNSEVYLLLKTMTLSELTDLNAFMQSEFTGKGRYRNQVKILFQMLRDHIKTGSKQDLNKEAIFPEIFPDQSGSIGQVERVMHELLQIVRKFLLYQNYFQESNALNRQIHYASILRSKGLESKAMIQVTHVLKEVEGIAVKGDKHFSAGFDAAWLQYSLNSPNLTWKDDLQIASATKYLDLQYFSHKLQLANHYLLLNAISKMNKEEELPLVHEDFNIRPEYLENEPFINIAHQIYLLLSSPNPTREGFEALIALLGKFEQEMDGETVRFFYSYLRNYCALLIRAGHYDLNSVLFSIMVDNLNKGYYFYEGRIALGSYFNIANVAIRAGQLDWAFEFANQYKEMTFGNQEEKEETYNLFLAYYHHRKQEYDKAISCLPSSSQNLLHNLSIKTLEVMIYYDQQSELFHYKLDSFKMYISRSSKKLISEENRERHANFINFLAQISNTALGDQERTSRILNRINSKTHVAEKEWLLEKVENIMGKVN